MKAQPLEYAPQAKVNWRRALRLLVIALGPALLLSLLFIPFRETCIRMDAVTGSVEMQTTWPFRITRGPVITASALEVRLRKGGIRWNRDWQLISDTEYTLLGNVVSRGCGRAPLIYELQKSIPQFVAASTDEDLYWFVYMMQAGTQWQQHEALEAAWVRAMR